MALSSGPCKIFSSTALTRCRTCYNQMGGGRSGGRDVVVEIIEGDVTMEGGGISAADTQRLQDAKVTHMLHCAASVRLRCAEQ